jgi:Zn-dependent peptidase ImmA (M78 family)
LAHELAHLVYTHGSSLCFIPIKFGEVTGLEFKANQVAIELLLPGSGVVKDFRKRNFSRTPLERELAQMASRWGVSLQALGYRLENLALIERGFTDRIVEPKPKHFRRPKTPSWERQLGKTFVETSIEAYQKGLISSGKLAHALQIPIRKALERVEQEGK